MKTKWITRLMMAAFAQVLLAMPVSAGNITGSAHDFSGDGWSGGRICVACHAPHNTDTTIADAPLWNHKTSTATYTLYSSPTLKAAISQPGGNSKLCLSCHDGTVAVNSFGGVTGSTMISGENNLSTNLKKSHPIGFNYDAALVTANGSLHAVTDPANIGSGTQTKSGTISSLLLFNGKMECSSCHDVHNTFTATTTALVKLNPAGSSDCLTCHKK